MRLDVWESPEELERETERLLLGITTKDIMKSFEDGSNAYCCSYKTGAGNEVREDGRENRHSYP